MSPPWREEKKVEKDEKKGLTRRGGGWYSKQAVRDAALRLLEIGRDWKKVLDKADERW